MPFLTYLIPYKAKVAANAYIFIPVCKKLDPLEKEIGVSLLPHVSKVFERIIYKQINTYMEDKISN